MSFSRGPRAGAPGPSAPSQPRTSFTLDWNILNLQPAWALKSYFTCLKLFFCSSTLSKRTHQVTVSRRHSEGRETQTSGPKSMTSAAVPFASAFKITPRGQHWTLAGAPGLRPVRGRPVSPAASAASVSCAGKESRGRPRKRPRHTALSSVTGSRAWRIAFPLGMGGRPSGPCSPHSRQSPLEAPTPARGPGSPLPSRVVRGEGRSQAQAIFQAEDVLFPRKLLLDRRRAVLGAGERRTLAC